MMKNFFSLFILLVGLNSILIAGSPSFENPKRFTSEFWFGIRFPVADQTSDDMLSGFSLRFGLGYQLTKHFELFNLAFDFGSSSPQNPDYYYDYYYGLIQESVNIYGFPLTMRYRFQFKDQLEGFVGAGAAYYWFITRLDHPYFGELKSSRKRHGPGTLVEAGVFTDAFSDKLLVGLISNFTYLKTRGKTLTKPASTVDEKVTRIDPYLSFALCLRYYLGK
ncbi:MAG: hypothetical protein ONB31_00325 [candidate division KSB1 bacterium]|nr:hypothetical protein [candidate division KSB1 bacterium]MDZ7335083.1 hypothetical protein [candidate division KSB1 bacterium]MDZ7356248.1 hypothetical protein [candidate division KSB1 bacterium]MDZ7400053.1 hypothetical protein [candidate division KSB1 bacterium]